MVMVEQIRVRMKVPMKTILFLLMILPMSSILESPAAFAACDSYTYGATPYCACANVNGAAAAAAGHAGLSAKIS